MANDGEVIGGEYLNAKVSTNRKGELVLQSGMKKLPKLDPETVAHWCDISEAQISNIMGRVGAVGQAVAGILPGFVGKMATAAVTATFDLTKMVRVDRLDGEQSVLKFPEGLYTHLSVVLRDQQQESDEELDEDAAPAPVAALNANPDFSDQLKKLADLRDQGILSEAEFSQKKTELLARI
ncbi:MAG: SHOCT domain-containing protein [Microbacteriaceae bacterium]